LGLLQFLVGLQKAALTLRRIGSAIDYAKTCPSSREDTTTLSQFPETKKITTLA